MFKIQFEANTVVAFIIFSTLFTIGIKLLFFQDANLGRRAGRFVLVNIKNDINKILYNDKLEKELVELGFKISFIKYFKPYQIARYSILLVTLFIFLFKSYMATSSLSSVVFILIMFLLSNPRLKYGKYWTVFGHVMKSLEEEHRKKKDMELSSIIIQLQNVAVSQKDEPTTLSHMLLSIIRFTKYTRTAFVKMLSYLDQGKEEEAKNAFISEIDTSLGKDLAYILIEMDQIEPVEIINQLKLLEDRVIKENLANKNKTEEMYSNFMYLVPIALCFIVLLNFLMIVLNIVTEGIAAF